MKIFQCAIMGVILSLGSSLSGKAQQKPYSFNEIYQVSDSPTLRINANDGEVEVFPSDKNEIEVFYIVERDNRLLKLTRKELEEDMLIDVVATTDMLEISVKQKYQYRIMNWRDRINVSFEIYAPVRTSCDIQCSDGDIAIRDLKARQKLNSSDGNIEARNITGELYARTSDGDLYMDQIVGDVELVTSDGDVIVRGVTGRVDARTSDGDAEVENIVGNVDLVTSDGDLTAEKITGDVRCTSSDGDIRIGQSNGAMNLTTSDGSISFRDLSGSLKARTSDGQIKGNMLKLTHALELRTSDGDIYVTVPDRMGLNLLLRGEVIRTNLSVVKGTSRDRLVEGEVNGGGPLVDLHASDGTVSLSYD